MTVRRCCVSAAIYRERCGPFREGDCEFAVEIRHEHQRTRVNRNEENDDALEA